MISPPLFAALRPFLFHEERTTVCAPFRNYGLHNTPKYDILLPNILGKCDWMYTFERMDGRLHERAYFCQDVSFAPPLLPRLGGTTGNRGSVVQRVCDRLPCKDAQYGCIVAVVRPWHGVVRCPAVPQKYCAVLSVPYFPCAPHHDGKSAWVFWAGRILNVSIFNRKRR